MHPLGQVLVDTIDGRFPNPDGRWERVPLWRDGVEGAISLTGRAYLAVANDISDGYLGELGVNGLGGAGQARVTVALAGSGYVECFDGLFGRRAPRSDPQVTPLVERPDLSDHPRVALARQLRSDVKVLGRADTDGGLLTVGYGIGGLIEFGIETATQGRGQGAALIRSALATLEPGTPVLAACAPGNTRAVRTFLACGFVPVGEAQLWCPQRGRGGRSRDL
ncbi:hypothetical protein [Demetria terragena]|uniref:hypothetical protein n=1 Tax=Demetria terragena TaxID=63959 RepID=UPI00039A0D43|nr:hypothetical protein [Demetria terragena]